MSTYQYGALAGLPVLLLMLYINDASPENVGRRFFVIFFNENQQTNSQPFLVAIPNTNATVNVTVHMPHSSDLFRPMLNTLKDGRPATIRLPSTGRTPGCSTEANGIEISSTDEIALYASSSAVGFFTLPLSSLGDTYRVVSSLKSTRHHSTLTLVAVTNDTDVNITIPSGNVNVTYDGRSYTHGDVLRVVLQAYNTVRLESEQNLTGVYIRGTKHFALLSGLVSNDCVCALCEGYNTEQVVPTAGWGRYFATSSYTATGDTVRIIANEDNTTVSMMTSRNTTYFDLSEGGYVDVRLSGDETDLVVVNATRVIRLLQLVDGRLLNPDYPWRQTFPLNVPHVTGYTNQYTIYIDDSNQTRLFHVIFYSDTSDGLTLDGRPVIATVKSNIHDGTRTWQIIGFRATLTRGVHVMRHPNVRFGAMTSDGVFLRTTPQPRSSTETSATNAIAYVAELDNNDDVINLHVASGGFSSSDKTGITRTVVAVIVSLSSAVFLVVVCILGFLAAEFLGRPDNFTHAKVTPFLDSPPHD